MSLNRADTKGRTVRSSKQKADCRADTRGGRWAGIPICLIESPSWRDLSLHARAVLVELTARMNGWNNGSIAVSHRELVDGLGCSPNRIVKALADLMEHGFLDVSAEGQWKERQAREYRLTFVTTKGAPATNDYLRWTPKEQSGATGAVAGKGQSATGAIAAGAKPATGAIARLREHKRKTANTEIPPATGAVALICKPYPPGQLDGPRGDNGSCSDPLSTAAPRFDSGTGKGDVERTIAAAIKSVWQNLNIDQRANLAARHGATREEVSRCLEGTAYMPIGKLVAIRRSALGMAGIGA